MQAWFRNYIAHPSQAAAAWLLNTFFALLPIDWASGLGSWVGRTFGPHLQVTQTALRNLRMIFPDLNEEQIDNIISGMWDNLGRTAGEHPHLSKFDPYVENSRVEVVGGEYIDLLRDDGQPGLLFAGHIGNWELSPLAGSRRGLVVHLIYRRANNPFFDHLVQKGRSALDGDLFAKGAEGSKEILRALRRGDHIAMLVDQKMNDGILAPFLGKDAMTAPAVAQLAIRYDCPLVPTQVERLGGARFRVTFYPPMEKPDTGDKKADIAALTTEVNRHIGDWIKQHPEQWLWVHNRWPG